MVVIIPYQQLLLGPLSHDFTQLNPWSFYGEPTSAGCPDKTFPRHKYYVYPEDSDTEDSSDEESDDIIEVSVNVSKNKQPTSQIPIVIERGADRDNCLATRCHRDKLFLSTRSHHNSPQNNGDVSHSNQTTMVKTRSGGNSHQTGHNVDKNEQERGDMGKESLATGQNSVCTSPDVEMTGFSHTEVNRRKKRTFALVGEDVLGGDMLTDEAINLAQNILHKEFAEIGGLEDTSLGPAMNFSVNRGRFVQILHNMACHWVCISNIGCPPGVIRLYDSLNGGAVQPAIRKQLAAIVYEQDPEIRVEIEPVQKQTNSTDCGVYAIAFATSLLYGHDPADVNYDVEKLRYHLFECLRDERLTPFPERTGSNVGRIKRRHVWVPLTCSCRMPYDVGDKLTDTIQCHACGLRYHTHCEEIPPELLEIDTQWLCRQCRRHERENSK